MVVVYHQLYHQFLYNQLFHLHLYFQNLLLPKKYRFLHIFICHVLLLIGVIFSLIPTFKRMHDGTATTELKEWMVLAIYIYNRLSTSCINEYFSRTITNKIYSTSTRK